ncbi:hypothetical protein KGP87_26830 [Burkholderia multivorans]|uniref:spike base protein, RCAP_Rcc01079 family n=1 Tax=Burkholderia multivorans TaxID=87883 RepID=UPI0020A481F4|nr:tail fiber domain-containing protein [Burkholderia multivorans]MCO8579933.1 hypothetical protein [Burkholderia multivorans]
MQTGPYSTYSTAAAITPSDTAAQTYRAIYVGGAGNVAVKTTGGNTVTFTAPPVGSIIRRIGTWRNGLGVYSYRYVWEKSGSHIGFMADEVREKAPEAVARGEDGFDRVNYGLAVR